MLYGGVPAPAKKKSQAGDKPRSKANPSIELLDDVPLTHFKRHPPPPRRLPLTHFKKPAVVRKPACASPSESVEGEMDVDEEEDQSLDEDAEGEEEDEIYLPNDEDDANSYDHNDTMSEDGVLGEDKEVEQESLNISSGEDKGSAKPKKKRKQDKGPKECIENSPAWEHFEKVMAHSKDDPEGAKPKVLKAKCNHCNKLYACVQGSSTSTLNRHWTKCKHHLRNLERVKIQKRLGFKPINASANSPMGDVGFEQSIVKELIAKMIMVHNYSFRML